ncbi:2-amino-4-hydroxy-6-hydroxymethyldihydropteridine diphosphokinase [Paenibacillus sp. FSL M7-1455]|jgi:2-amino-4-hydroxy-6-hydroxymethyldihydropteridine diphosphokinase|uniref:2-amino-4-hydroxy-6-hydroxymethyldihydropteridine diphosphokinase n=1 Tax=Paenibacillus cookii TaxID=157839 RepID=A0ABQ4M224_9BACL|nr:2-amino-4-hydroxy-6-hydroxymethyldihydropteridine diphosphokinase [Paenibacillus cookii]KHF33778.1 Bifunctional folate synthesis protein [Paenibacillus sp. P1XP2]GIO69591.1 2-amino-4-hydroxy-6-hydroxymethyldihydropteridine pyrophosphokinase [Paenibacillus cookii]HWO55834.1 2-amino-4-hydroxy-6-hydroxymethyldihydropteridine diphosphokinase [Paenibacillus cookii]
MNAQSTSESSEAYIALGANLGDREETLMDAVQRLDRHPDVAVLECSDLYETEPVGYVDQPLFLNMAVRVRTTLDAYGLLHVMQQIEKDLGRVRHIRWGPRTVDLDLIWMEGRRENTEELILPHPRMEERLFVLVPLKDVVPEGESSGLRPILFAALERLDGKDGLQLWKTCSWHSASAPFGS